MPTAAKLVAGMGLAITAMIAAYYFMLDQGDYRIGPNFVLGNFSVGFFVGWFSLGRNPGHGNISAITSGFRALFLLVIVSSMIFSSFLAFITMQRQTSRELMDLPILWLEITLKYTVMAMTKEVVIALLIGGCLTGLATYQASRRWS